MLKLGEHLLDRVEVGPVWRQEQEACTPGPDRSPDGGLLVAGQVIEDDNVACAKRWTELLLDPLRERRAIDRLIEDEAIDRLIEDEGRVDPVAAQGGDEGHRLPVTIRHFGMEPLTFFGAHPGKKAMLVFAQVSSIKTRRARSGRP